MKKWALLLSRLPILWKLTLYSSLLLCLLFVGYNTIQYFVIKHWLTAQTEAAIQKSMGELQVYYQEKDLTLDAQNIQESRSFIEKLNQNNQMIRIIDSKGTPILTVTDGLPPAWVEPRNTSVPELSYTWHIEDHLLIARSPLVSKSFNGTVEIVNHIETFDQLNDFILFVMLAGGVIAIFFSGLGGRVLARQLIKPVKSITDTMGKIKQTGLHERVTFIDNHDEISDLSRMFNEMMDQLEDAFRQQQQFVEDASHELRTPIAVIEGHLSLLTRWGKNDPAVLEESLNVSLQELRRLKELVQELLVLSKAESEHSDAKAGIVSPEQAIRNVIKKTSAVHPEFVFEMELGKLQSVNIQIAPQHFEQILFILLDNAMKYSAEDKRIKAAGCVQDGRVQIELADCGVGIPEEDLPHVFNRFYRADKARSRAQGGHGLGLAIAKRLVERYGGTIAVKTNPEGGTTAVLRFPALEQS